MVVVVVVLVLVLLLLLLLLQVLLVVVLLLVVVVHHAPAPTIVNYIWDQNALTMEEHRKIREIVSYYHERKSKLKKKIDFEKTEIHTQTNSEKKLETLLFIPTKFLSNGVRCS